MALLTPQQQAQQAGKTPRQQQLQTLSGQFMPQAQETAAGMQNARVTNLQQAVQKAVQTGQSGPQLAQQMGAQQAQQTGAINLQAAQQAQGQQAQLGQAALQQQGQEAQASLFDRDLALQQKRRDLTNQLAKLDTRLKNELFDKQLQFQKDEYGRTLFNERQLMDYKLATARSDEEFRNYEQRVQQESARKMQVLKAAYSKLNQEIEQDNRRTEQRLNNEQKMRIAKAKQELEEKMRKERAKQANRAAAFSAGGAIVGAVAGSFAANPAAGAMVGAEVGKGAGSVAASQTS
jgi:hypothetical protein